MKRGQTQQIFVWIFVLVVAAAILFFGIKLIKKSESLKDEVLVVRFFQNLDKKLSQYYFLDKGSNGEERFLLPNEVREVCFVKSEMITSSENNYFYQLREFSDVFIKPESLYSENRYNLTTKFTFTANSTFKCLNVVNGVLNVEFMNQGANNGVEIK